ncbi:hypothetical protein N015_13385 [Pseudomonas asturiensis]|uniref:Membrane-anchored ribosome-binding protein, inhibits growth in stationary phase, ElaB/YqjD/DUF883 family n=1 Tax=Pseudomonas asturiensis TaxID=1190415 RepID=A0ABX6HCX2_9PSED|nr:hypothetical protein [Pseudomonas asturiensis]QHF03347.1 hypothetical protein N015_13385 [Pseudomonas asturiensis]
MNPATASRAEVRDFVKARTQERFDAKKKGENVAHVELDQQDALEDLVKDLDHAEKERFLRIFVEEATAAIQAEQPDSDKIIRDMKRANGQEAKVAGVVMILVIVVVLLLVLKN